MVNETFMSILTYRKSVLNYR